MRFNCIQLKQVNCSIIPELTMRRCATTLARKSRYVSMSTSRRPYTSGPRMHNNTCTEKDKVSPCLHQQQVTNALSGTIENK